MRATRPVVLIELPFNSGFGFWKRINKFSTSKKKAIVTLYVQGNRTRIPVLKKMQFTSAHQRPVIYMRLSWSPPSHLGHHAIVSVRLESISTLESVSTSGHQEPYLIKSIA